MNLTVRLQTRPCDIQKAINDEISTTRDSREKCFIVNKIDGRLIDYPFNIQ